MSIVNSDPGKNSLESEARRAPHVQPVGQTPLAENAKSGPLPSSRSQDTSADARDDFAKLCKLSFEWLTFSELLWTRGGNDADGEPTPPFSAASQDAEGALISRWQSFPDPTMPPIGNDIGTVSDIVRGMAKCWQRRYTKEPECGPAKQWVDVLTEEEKSARLECTALRIGDHCREHFKEVISYIQANELTAHARDSSLRTKMPEVMRQLTEMQKLSQSMKDSHVESFPRLTGDYLHSLGQSLQWYLGLKDRDCKTDWGKELDKMISQISKAEKLSTASVTETDNAGGI